MLKISYIGHANMASHVVLRFASNSPIEDRAQWKEVLSEIRAATVATETVVKNEPGIAPASASSSSSIAAPSSSSAVSASATSASSVLPRSASAAPFTTTTTTTAGGGGVKRTHQTMAATGSAASASAAGHVFAASSTTSPAVVVANNNNTALTSADQQALMKCRAAILARDKETAATHADLVPSTLSEDEFWSQREDMLRQEQTRLGVSINGGTRSSGMSVQQQAGVSSAMAANIRPDTSGSSNIVRFSLDATQIHSIFLEYPMVYELYQQLVPHTLDEKTFWTKFFKSQYENNQNESGGQTTTSNVTSRVDSFGPSSSLVPHDDDLFSRARQMQDARDHATINATGSTSVQSTGTYNNMVPPAVGSEAALAEQARDTGTKSLLLSRRIDPSVDLTAADFTDAVLLSVLPFTCMFWRRCEMNLFQKSCCYLICIVSFPVQYSFARICVCICDVCVTERIRRCYLMMHPFPPPVHAIVLVPNVHVLKQNLFNVSIVMVCLYLIVVRCLVALIILPLVCNRHQVSRVFNLHIMHNWHPV